jgi:hypothetical protein
MRMWMQIVEEETPMRCLYSGMTWMMMMATADRRREGRRLARLVLVSWAA